MNTRHLLRCAGACVLATASLAARADYDSSGFALRVGVHDVIPGSSTDTPVGKIGVNDRVGPTFNVDYAFCGHYVVDLLGALPFTHNLTLNGAHVGTTQHLPPTLSIQYHPQLGHTFDPFLGVGVNYTMFRNESLDGGAKLKLDNSVGFAAQLGVDWNLTRHWLIGVDGRFMQIEPTAHINGTDIGRVKVDPVAVGINVGYRF